MSTLDEELPPHLQRRRSSKRSNPLQRRRISVIDHLGSASEDVQHALESVLSEDTQSPHAKSNLSVVDSASSQSGKANSHRHRHKDHGYPRPISSTAAALDRRFRRNDSSIDMRAAKLAERRKRLLESTSHSAMHSEGSLPSVSSLPSRATRPKEELKSMGSDADARGRILTHQRRLSTTGHDAHPSPLPASLLAPTQSLQHDAVTASLRDDPFADLDDDSDDDSGPARGPLAKRNANGTKPKPKGWAKLKLMRQDSGLLFKRHASDIISAFQCTPSNNDVLAHRILKKRPIYRSNNDIDFLVRYTRHVPFLQYFASDERRLLCQNLVYQSVRQGKRIFQEDDAPDGFYIVLFGVVSIHQRMPDDEDTRRLVYRNQLSALVQKQQQRYQDSLRNDGPPSTSAPSNANSNVSPSTISGNAASSSSSSSIAAATNTTSTVQTLSPAVSSALESSGIEGDLHHGHANMSEKQRKLTLDAYLQAESHARLSDADRAILHRFISDHNLEQLESTYGHVLAVAGPSSSFGELALARVAPRSATAVALTDVELMCVPIEHYQNTFTTGTQATLHDKIDVLRGLDFFARWSTNDLMRLCWNVIERQYTRHEVVHHTGEDAHHLFFIKKGECKVTYSIDQSALDKSGHNALDYENESKVARRRALMKHPKVHIPRKKQTIELAMLYQGEMFGEDALLTNANGKYCVTVTTTKDCTLLLMPIHDLQRKLDSQTMRTILQVARTKRNHREDKIELFAQHQLHDLERWDADSFESPVFLPNIDTSGASVRQTMDTSTSSATSTSSPAHADIERAARQQQRERQRMDEQTKADEHARAQHLHTLIQQVVQEREHEDTQDTRHPHLQDPEVLTRKRLRRANKKVASMSRLKKLARPRVQVRDRRLMQEMQRNLLNPELTLDQVMDAFMVATQERQRSRMRRRPKRSDASGTGTNAASSSGSKSLTMSRSRSNR